jgi:hypothetical protein
MVETVTVADLAGWDAELRFLTDGLGCLFKRPEPRATFTSMIRAMLADVAKKNSWGLAEYVGLATPQAFEHLLNGAKWSADWHQLDVGAERRRSRRPARRDHGLRRKLGTPGGQPWPRSRSARSRWPDERDRSMTESDSGARKGDRWETAFYLSLLILGGLELAFHSSLPRWITLGGIPVMLVYVIVGFILIRRRRS